MARRKDESELLEREVQAKARDQIYKEFGEFHHRDNPKGLVKVIKLTTLAQFGEVGWPDHAWFVRAKPVPKVIFVEWKRGDEPCTEIQIERHLMLRAMGFEVYVGNGLSRGVQTLRNAINRALGRTKKWPGNVAMPLGTVP